MTQPDTFIRVSYGVRDDGSPLCIVTVKNDADEELVEVGMTPETAKRIGLDMIECGANAEKDSEFFRLLIAGSEPFADIERANEILLRLRYLREHAEAV